MQLAESGTLFGGLTQEQVFDLSQSHRTLNQSVMGPSSSYLIRKSRTYDAFDDDIAVVHFYFETQTVLEFSTTSAQGNGLMKASKIQATLFYPIVNPD